MTEQVKYNFDTVSDTAGIVTFKRSRYQGQDVLPLWIADMEFDTPAVILQALRQRLDIPAFGYQGVQESLNEAFASWAEAHYGWQVKKEWLVWVTNLVTGLDLACEAACQGSGSVLLPTPAYPPMAVAPSFGGADVIKSPMVKDADGIWRMDFDAMQAALREDTKLLIFCNPQNPTGRVFKLDELRQVIEFCKKNDLLLCSDDIHGPIVVDPHSKHIPIGMIDPDFADRVITLTAMTKAFNTQSVGAGVAIIPDPRLRELYRAAQFRYRQVPGALECAAAEASYRDTTGWIDQLTDYLRGNLELVRKFVEGKAGLAMSNVEGTYLAWIEVTGLDSIGDVEAFFANHGLGIAPGAKFGDASHVRLCYACPRPMLIEGLARFDRAISALHRSD